MMKRLTALVILGVMVGCEGEPTNRTPYGRGEMMLIGLEKGGTPGEVDEDCDSEECAAAVEACGRDAFVDVVLDENQSLLDVICYPGNVTVVEVGEEAVPSATAGNHTVLVLDGEDDEIDVTGDVTLSGNGSIVYGEGPEVSVIGGTLAIEKNNAIVRGVRIEGDVTITKNNAKIVFSEIMGDLIIEGNNATLAESIVHGEVRIAGNNAVLVQNELAELGAVTGNNLSCNANVELVETESDAASTGESADAGAAPAPEPVPIVCGDAPGDGDGEAGDQNPDAEGEPESDVEEEP